MTTNNNDANTSEVMSCVRKIATICMYAIGVFYIFLGIVGTFAIGYITGIVFMIGGLITIPYTRDYISKKSKTKRIGGIVALVILFVSLIVASIAAPPMEVSTDITPAPKEVVTPIITPSPIPTHTAAPTPTPRRILKIGDKSIMERSEVTLLSGQCGLYYIWYGVSGSVYREYAETDNMFVILEVNIKSTDHETHYGRSNFYLIDHDGYRYDTIRYKGEDGLNNQELAKGQQTRGIIVCEIPKNSRGVELMYEYGTSDSWLFHHETSTWSITNINRIN